MRRCLDLGAGIIVEASLPPSTAAAALVWGNFAEEWVLMGGATEVLADLIWTLAQGTIERLEWRASTVGRD